MATRKNLIVYLYLSPSFMQAAVTHGLDYAIEWYDFGLSFSLKKHEKTTAVLVREFPLAVNFPDTADLVNPLIQAMRAEQNTIRAQAEYKARELDGKIQNLLALPAPSSTNTENDDDLPF